jgi:hypothetical protein
MYKVCGVYIRLNISVSLKKKKKAKEAKLLLFKTNPPLQKLINAPITALIHSGG